MAEPTSRGTKWTDTECGLLYTFIKDSGAEKNRLALSNSRVAEEMRKETEWLRSTGERADLPVPPRNYTATIIGSKSLNMEKSEKNKDIFSAIPLRNPHRCIAPSSDSRFVARVGTPAGSALKAPAAPPRQPGTTTTQTSSYASNLGVGAPHNAPYSQYINHQLQGTTPSASSQQYPSQTCFIPSQRQVLGPGSAGRQVMNQSWMSHGQAQVPKHFGNVSFSEGNNLHPPRSGDSQNYSPRTVFQPNLQSRQFSAQSEVTPSYQHAMSNAQLYGQRGQGGPAADPASAQRSVILKNSQALLEQHQNYLQSNQEAPDFSPQPSRQRILNAYNSPQYQSAVGSLDSRGSWPKSQGQVLKQQQQSPQQQQRRADYHRKHSAGLQQGSDQPSGSNSRGSPGTLPSQVSQQQQEQQQGNLPNYQQALDSDDMDEPKDYDDWLAHIGFLDQIARPVQQVQAQFGDLTAPSLQSTPRHPRSQRQGKYARDIQQPSAGLHQAGKQLNALGLQSPYPPSKKQAFTDRDFVRPPLIQPQSLPQEWQKSPAQPRNPQQLQQSSAKIKPSPQQWQNPSSQPKSFFARSFGDGSIDGQARSTIALQGLQDQAALKAPQQVPASNITPTHTHQNPLDVVTQHVLSEWRKHHNSEMPAESVPIYVNKFLQRRKLDSALNPTQEAESMAASSTYTDERYKAARALNQYILGEWTTVLGSDMQPTPEDLKTFEATPFMVKFFEKFKAGFQKNVDAASSGLDNASIMDKLVQPEIRAPKPVNPQAISRVVNDKVQDEVGTQSRQALQSQAAQVDQPRIRTVSRAEVEAQLGAGHNSSSQSVILSKPQAAPLNPPQKPTSYTQVDAGEELLLALSNRQNAQTPARAGLMNGSQPVASPNSQTINAHPPPKRKYSQTEDGADSLSAIGMGRNIESPQKEQVNSGQHQAKRIKATLMALEQPQPTGQLSGQKSFLPPTPTHNTLPPPTTRNTFPDPPVPKEEVFPHQMNAQQQSIAQQQFNAQRLQMALQQSGARQTPLFTPKPLPSQPLAQFPMPQNLPSPPEAATQPPPTRKRSLPYEEPIPAHPPGSGYPPLKRSCFATPRPRVRRAVTQTATPPFHYTALPPPGFHPSSMIHTQNTPTISMLNKTFTPTALPVTGKCYPEDETDWIPSGPYTAFVVPVPKMKVSPNVPAISITNNNTLMPTTSSVKGNSSLSPVEGTSLSPIVINDDGPMASGSVKPTTGTVTASMNLGNGSVNGNPWLGLSAAAYNEKDVEFYADVWADLMETVRPGSTQF
jgi:hypothetical protein